MRTTIETSSVRQVKVARRCAANIKANNASTRNGISDEDQSHAPKTRTSENNASPKSARRTPALGRRGSIALAAVKNPKAAPINPIES
ncbi:MAG: hypothetical protein ACKVKG_19360, partial [Alphaproteobacteria bacterium]